MDRSISTSRAESLLVREKDCRVPGGNVVKRDRVRRFRREARVVRDNVVFDPIANSNIKRVRHAKSTRLILLFDSRCVYDLFWGMNMGRSVFVQNSFVVEASALVLVPATPACQ